MTHKVVMNADDIRRTLARISHEIIERQKSLDQLVLIGLHTRGIPLARRLSINIQHFGKVQVPVGTLDFNLYRDDFASSSLQPSIKETNIPFSIDGKIVIIVDDVLNTGRSIRAAMDALIDMGRPKVIKLAVLIDRGHRELPIRADFSGKNIPSSSDEDVRVKLSETDDNDEVTITPAPKESE